MLAKKKVGLGACSPNHQQHGQGERHMPVVLELVSVFLREVGGGRKL